MLLGCLVLSLFAFSFFQNKLESPCANSISCIKDLSGNYDAGKSVGTFLGQKVRIPKQIAQTDQNVLGDQTAANKHIYVDLTKQHLYAFDGNNLVYDFPVSTGKWHPTPTGDFTIWIKLRYTRMTGGEQSDGTFYDLPNVPFVMFFAGANADRGQGFSIHGAYWHNNFGHPMSHGCVNMRTEDAAKIFYWATPNGVGYDNQASSDDPGTPVTIYGVAPEG